MEKTKLVNLLSDLSSDGLPGRNHSTELLENKYKEICKQLDCDYENIRNALKSTTDLYFSNEINTDWKYICLSLYILHLLNRELVSQDELLSVQQSKTIKNCIDNIVIVGILTKIQSNLPFYVAIHQPDPTDIFLNYNILKCTTHGLCELLKYPILRLLILPDSLRAILVAVYQICFCPLKKPDQKTERKSSVMSEEIYNKLTEEKTLFLKLLQHLRATIHPGIFVKETMAIFYTSAPNWFKKSVSHTLTSIIRSQNGVEHVAVALLDGANDDSAKTWKILEVFSKLILSCKDFPDFRDNICKQLTTMLDKVTDESLVFERIYTHCTKAIYHADEEMGKNIFVRRIVVFFLYFTYKDHKFEEGEFLTNKIKQHVRLLHAVFAEKSVDNPNLPVKLLTPVVNVIFRLYAFTSNTSLKNVNTELKDVLISFLDSNSVDQFILFDSFLFGINSKEILTFRNDIILKTEKEDVLLNYSDHAVTYSVVENSDCLLDLLKNRTHIRVKLFGYLLNCLVHKDKYFHKSNEGLLNIETEFMSEFVERKLTVYKLLSDLAEDKDIQAVITDDPHDIIKYINNVLEAAIAKSVHKTTDFDSEEFQIFFTILMILQILVINSSKINLKVFKILNVLLEVIENETVNNEVKDLVGKILEILERGKAKPRRMVVEEVKSELDKALENICDPLLPVRGHGLMSLTKLVEKKDKNAMERKQYILNIFQQSLKNEDSYIYLSAIGGLSAMADLFPDTVLKILCEEYSDSSREDKDDGHEVRMKLGESLVRVTRLLGDMAPKYKPLLLNTFLMGAKDEDDLIRASSLSNLGEICRVLGYKLGTIVTEVLVCVHAVITTDKSPEARRAAVTVLRQLLAGLESEMIAFLKDDILPIYRTLKEIYDNDKDEVVRLQAQLALEELNENMRNFVFPKPQLNAEKKIIMLN
ncbi:transport and Golgi organization protein 6 homolog [Anoplophora glabripennis]|uniref:transport and Golgi organization protein 6 homolog n=1 Tax=Anoplophora glabripennis TaxID=217634 RepID=UPI00087434C2|nr:transport and Golgi organization protein 6 homolog [Anoplophora glabripennis]